MLRKLGVSTLTYELGRKTHYSTNPTGAWLKIGRLRGEAQRGCEERTIKKKIHSIREQNLSDWHSFGLGMVWGVRVRAGESRQRRKRRSRHKAQANLFKRVEVYIMGGSDAFRVDSLEVILAVRPQPSLLISQTFAVWCFHLQCMWYLLHRVPQKKNHRIIHRKVSAPCGLLWSYTVCRDVCGFRAMVDSGKAPPRERSTFKVKSW